MVKKKTSLFAALLTLTLSTGRVTQGLNPLPPMSDQDRISPYNINTISSKQVIRIKKNIS